MVVVANEKQEKKEEEKKEGGRKEATNIKSHNPHLAGGEKRPFYSHDLEIYCSFLLNTDFFWMAPWKTIYTLKVNIPMWRLSTETVR